MSAVGEARRGLIRAGFGAQLSAAAAPKDSLFGSTPAEQCALLAEIASYLGDRDPTMIGAAFLLEQEGYERSQLALSLDGVGSEPEIDQIARATGADCPVTGQ